MTTNSVPRVPLEDDTAAWERRLRAWRFHPYEVKKIVHHFAREILTTEGPILINRLVAGAVRRIALQSDGKRPEVPEAMRDLTDEILRRSCPLATFIESWVVAQHGCQINRSELFDLFNAAMREQRNRVWDRADFNKRAAELMSREHGAKLSNSVDGGGKGWRSLRLKQVHEL